MPRTYRMITVIPAAITQLDANRANPTVIATPATSRVRSINAAADFPRLIREYSDGMADIDMTVKIWPGTLTVNEQFFSTNIGVTFWSGEQVAQRTGDFGKYDFYAVHCEPAELGNTFIGVARGTGMWNKANDTRILQVAAHELAHNLERYLKPLGYNNWPTCGQDLATTSTSVHCFAAYGYPNDSSKEWLSPYFRAGYPDGKGINAAGWAIQTPTERGLRTLPTKAEQVLRPWSEHKSFVVRRPA